MEEKDFWGLIGLGIALVIGGIVLWNYSVPLFFVALCVICGAIYLLNMSLINGASELAKSKELIISKATAELNASIDKHRDTLLRKFEQTVYKNDYGVEVTDRWESEINYFLDNIGFPSGLILGAAYDPDTMEDLVDTATKLQLADQFAASAPQLVDQKIRAHSSLISTRYPPTPKTPLDFEHSCCSVLRQNGWKARTTKATGDQGVDIIAERNGVRVVFQCKLHGTPVGNSAVQEIIGGREFYKADVAAVISVSGYTPAAKQLASTSQVRLINYDALANFNID